MSEHNTQGWLEQSGQAWKLRVAVGAAYFGFLMLAVALVLVGRSNFGVGALLLVPMAGALNAFLPMLVRCRVCGLQIETSSWARRLTRDARLTWIEGLESCPGCGDDGSATVESRARWVRSGVALEDPYWSRWRVVWAALVTLLFVGGGLAIGMLYRVRP